MQTGRRSFLKGLLAAIGGISLQKQVEAKAKIPPYVRKYMDNQVPKEIVKESYKPGPFQSGYVAICPSGSFASAYCLTGSYIACSGSYLPKPNE